MTAPAPTLLPRDLLPGRRLLVLQNPGRGSRFYLTGILAALQRLRIHHCSLELQDLWDAKSDKPRLVRDLSQFLVQQKIGAILSYGLNGITDVPLDQGLTHTLRSFWEIRGIPHLMLWLDHPHWHADNAGLRPEVQGLLRSANCIHFLKSPAHARDAERILGWPNCCGLPAAIDPDQFPLSPHAELSNSSASLEFDLVAICGEGGGLPSWLKPFLSLDDPDPAAIRAVLVAQAIAALDALWEKEASPGMQPELQALSRRWVHLKNAQPFLAAGRHWATLSDEFPGACWYLTLMYPLWMAALRILWRLREWERRFYPAWLARFFNVGLFGADWSSLGLGPGGRVEFLDQAATYARGKVALNITDGHDEEGLTLKPFEIAASGVPMLHYHAEGLDECFTPGAEVEVFRTPREAREKLAVLLANPHRRITLAAAARDRTLRDHTWDRRIEAMLHFARLPLDAFRS